MADTTLIVGVAGTLAGAATGAFISARATIAVDARRAHREQQEEAIALRGAARLVWLDLAVADSNLGWAASGGTWHPTIVRLPMDAWERHRERLAAGITDPADWDIVANGMAALAHFSALSSDWSEPRQLRQETVVAIAEVRAVVLGAAEVLRPIAGMAPQDRAAGPATA